MLLARLRRWIDAHRCIGCVIGLWLVLLHPFISAHFHSDGLEDEPGLKVRNAGETVRFNVRNSGKIRHEMVLGSEADLQAHYAMMMQDPGMRHEEANAVSLDAGKSGQIVWKFDRAGSVSFGCLEPGHYAAGMKGAVSVQ